MTRRRLFIFGILGAIILLAVIFWRFILEGIFLLFAFAILRPVALKLLGVRPRARRRSLLESTEKLVEAIALALIARNTVPPKREKFPPSTPQPVYSKSQGDFPKGY